MPKMLDVSVAWTDFPPTDEDRTRLKRYKRYERMFDGLHEEVFGRARAFLAGENPAEAKYLAVNICQRISKLSADMLFSEDLVFKSASDDAEARAAAESSMLAIANRSRLQPEAHASAMSGSAKGDSFVQVRFDDSPAREEDRGSYIEFVPADYVFVQLDPQNLKKVDKIAVAYIVEEEIADVAGVKTEKRTMMRTIHTWRHIRAEQWDMNATPPALLGRNDADTGYDGLLIWHVPNTRKDNDFWGLSDYSSFDDLQDELNNSVSRLGRVLDKYSDPMMAVPHGALSDDPLNETPLHRSEHSLYTDPVFIPNGGRVPLPFAPSNRYGMSAGGSKVFEGDAESLQSIPRYIEWNADLSSRLAQIDKILDLIMLVSETSPAAFGLDEGGSPESGRALRYRTRSTLAMTRRKMQYWHPVLVEAMYAALTLEYQNMSGRPKPERPNIDWPDGQPDDQRELIDNAAVLRQNSLSSQRTAVGVALQIEGKELDAEMAEIERERAANAATFGLDIPSPDDDERGVTVGEPGAE